MAWVYGQVTGTQELARIISEIALGVSLQSIDAVGTAGTGYVAGDELTLSGGDFTIPAIAEVLTVGGSGEVLTARIRNAGLYQNAPSNDVATTGGSGSGCELTCTFDTNGWVRRRATNVAGAAQSATVAAGGSGYVVGDVLTLSGGTGNVASTFRVATVSSGVVTSVTVVEQGSYATAPTSPVSTTGGSGTGCTLTVTFGNGTSEAEIIMEGPGSGSDEIYVGWKTYENAGNRQLELAGFTGFDTGLLWQNQPGISPGRSGSNGGHYCQTHQLAIPFWVSVTARRIMFVYKTVTSYGSGHLGFLDPYMTGSEWPYPMYIAGCGVYDTAGIAYTNEPNGSCVNPPGRTGSYGAGSVRDPAGTWVRICNTEAGSGSSTVNRDELGITWPWCSPSSSVDHIDSNDQFVNMTTGLQANQGPFSPNVPAQHYYRIFPTPNGGEPLFPRFPVTVLYDATFIYGVVHGAYAIAGSEVLVPENRVKEGDRRFTVFGSNATTVDDRGLWCIEEE